MTNLQKLQRLVEFFASCDWDHNSNRVIIEAYDNGWRVFIEFDRLNFTKVKLDLGYVASRSYQEEGTTYVIGWDVHGSLEAFVYDFEGLDFLLGEIFAHVVLTDLETILLDIKTNSE